MKEKKKVDEAYERLNTYKDTIEKNFNKFKEESQKKLANFERMKADMSRIEQDKIMMEEQNNRIEEDKIVIEEQKNKIVKDNEEKCKAYEKRFLDEQEYCMRLKSEIQQRDLLIVELNKNMQTKQDEVCRIKLECQFKVEELENELKLKATQLEDEMLSKDQFFQKENEKFQGISKFPIRNGRKDLSASQATSQGQDNAILPWTIWSLRSNIAKCKTNKLAQRPRKILVL